MMSHTEPDQNAPDEAVSELAAEMTAANLRRWGKPDAAYKEAIWNAIRAVSQG